MLCVMKLRQSAKRQGIRYLTALGWWQAGLIEGMEQHATG